MCKECESYIFEPREHKDEDEYWKLRFQCKDCDTDTNFGHKNYYMVNDDIWEAHGVGRDMLCIECLEKRVGRPLVAEDFSDCPLNLLLNPYVANLKLKARHGAR